MRDLGFQIGRDILATSRRLTRDCKAKVARCPHLDESDDEYQFVEASLDRWADRSYQDHRPKRWG